MIQKILAEKDIIYPENEIKKLIIDQYEILQNIAENSIQKLLILNLMEH